MVVLHHHSSPTTQRRACAPALVGQGRLLLWHRSRAAHVCEHRARPLRVPCLYVPYHIPCHVISHARSAPAQGPCLAGPSQGPDQAFSQIGPNGAFFRAPARPCSRNPPRSTQTQKTPIWSLSSRGSCRAGAAAVFHGAQPTLSWRLARHHAAGLRARSNREPLVPSLTCRGSSGEFKRGHDSLIDAYPPGSDVGGFSEERTLAVGTLNPAWSLRSDGSGPRSVSSQRVLDAGAICPDFLQRPHKRYGPGPQD